MFSKNQYLLFVCWILWCFLHSFFISNYFQNFTRSFFRDKFRYFRFSYNVISVLTFIPLVILSNMWQGDALFSWPGKLQILQKILLTLSLVLFIAPMTSYSFGQFSGLSMLSKDSYRKGIAEKGRLNTTGILKIIRHPWYTSAYILIWARDIHQASWVINIILSLYLMIGTLLEEKKLKEEFGSAYLSYQKQVPMYIPWKWLKDKFN